MTPNHPFAHRRGLVRLSAALASRRPSHLRLALEESLGVHTAAQVEEVILQSYLFLGYPTALNAFGLWREVSGVEPGDGGDDAWDLWSERGEEVCRTVYGGQYEGLRNNVKALHPDMERWMVVEGYGKVLARPGLDLVTRELCIGALLAVHGVPRQLYSHLRGALNAGASPLDVEEALAEAFRFATPEAEEEARGVWARIRARGVPGPGEAREKPSSQREVRNVR